MRWVYTRCVWSALTGVQREYEEEIERRIVPLQKKKQLEELRSMLGQEATTKSAPAASKQPLVGRKKRAARRDLSEDEGDSDRSAATPPPKRRAPATRRPVVQEESEAEEDEDSGSEDLFGSDEEAEISQRPSRSSHEAQGSGAGAGGKKVSKALGAARVVAAAQPRRSSRRGARDMEDGEEVDEDDDEDEEDDQLDGDGDDLRFDYNLKSIKDSHRMRGGERVSAPKPAVFDSLAALRSHLQDQQRLVVEAEPDDDEPAEHKDYLRIALRRDEVVKCLHEPYFAQFVTGAVVRVSLGVQANGSTLYRMAEVVGVEQQQRPDKLPATALQPSVSTGTRLRVSIAGQVKDKQRISMLSNHTISAQEVDYYLNKLRAAGQPLPRKRDVKLLRAQQKALNHYAYSHAEIQQMVSNRVGLDKSLATEYSTAMESLLKKRDAAKLTKDYDVLEAVNKTIDALEREDERQREQYEKSARKQVDMNRRMKDANVRRDMAAGMRKRQQDQLALANGVDASSALSDPFIRRETRPKILWNTGTRRSGSTPEEAPAVVSVPPVTSAVVPKASKSSGRQAAEDWQLSGSVDMDEVSSPSMSCSTCSS